jgi:hypothetical protein
MSEWPEFRFHPLADIFPEGAELDELVRANGVHQDIVLFDGMILDGRNRYRACIAADFPPITSDETKWIKDPAATCNRKSKSVRKPRPSVQRRMWGGHHGHCVCSRPRSTAE